MTRTVNNIINSRLLLRGIFEDPDVYANPEIFRPERFFDETLLDPMAIAFGYARR